MTCFQINLNLLKQYLEISYVANDSCLTKFEFFVTCILAMWYHCTLLLCEVASYKFAVLVSTDDHYFEKSTIPQPRVKNSDTSSKNYAKQKQLGL